MRYYEVFVADNQYRGDSPLTYSLEEEITPLSVVSVPLRQRLVTGFVSKQVSKPKFPAKPIKSVVSKQPLPAHCLELARWLKSYYACSLGEALRQFAPSQSSVRQIGQVDAPKTAVQLDLQSPLTNDQSKALKAINIAPSHTVLLHGDTGTGKTRVYLELAKKTIASGKSVIILTPEIALTGQLATVVENQLKATTYVLHSQLSIATRKKIWLAILESTQPVVVIGPRSALFSPIKSLGLLIIDEAHEPAYKQDQSPKYHTGRVASQLAVISGSKAVLGTATPSIDDYYLATEHKAVVRMRQLAAGSQLAEIDYQIVDLKDKNVFSVNGYLSDPLIDVIKTTLAAKQQVMLYLNRRGSARVIMCKDCGWQLLCPNCDVTLVYHADAHEGRCHICGYKQAPPKACPSCKNPDIVYKSIGSKALTEIVSKLFPNSRIQRFDSDNLEGEHINQLYDQLRSGQIDIIIGTQLVAKGLDLPKLGLVGIVSAESSLALPDYTAEERSFQLLYQVIGRVGRGHTKARVIIQTYEPRSVIVGAAINRDWDKFYKTALQERQKFRFPPFSYLLQLTCRRATAAGAEKAAVRLKQQLRSHNLAVEVIGPTPSFYARRGRYYYWQLVVKSKRRDHLLQLATSVPADWSINLDPNNLL